MKMEVEGSSETLLALYHTVRHHILEDRNFRGLCHEKIHTFLLAVFCGHVLSFGNINLMNQLGDWSVRFAIKLS
jgi:hypothetical protein